MDFWLHKVPIDVHNEHNPPQSSIFWSCALQGKTNHAKSFALHGSKVHMGHNGTKRSTMQLSKVCRCFGLSPPPRPFLAPHHTSATCLQSVTAFQPPTQPLVTPQNPFSMHAQAIAGPPLATPPWYYLRTQRTHLRCPRMLQQCSPLRFLLTTNIQELGKCKLTLYVI